MKISQLKISALILAGYTALVIVFFFLAGEQIHDKEKALPMVEGEEILAELNNITDIRQDFVSETDRIDKLSLKLVTLGRVNQGIVTLRLINQEDGQTVDELLMETSLLQDGTYYVWKLKNRAEHAAGVLFSLTFSSQCEPGEAPGIYYNSMADVNRLYLNGSEIPGSLCFTYAGSQELFLGKYYVWLALAAGFFIIVLLGNSFYAYNRGKPAQLILLWGIWKRYRFLIQQLVSRDFKTKYKRSILGYLWSFLNPLLTMLVQYIVFSTIFRSDIKNFPVYLLSGIILFNFFSEAVGQGLSAIVGNTALITKVYVPKYIYPVTKVLSCSINLMISMIPLLLMILFTGTRITKAILLLPYALLCLLIFCIGMSLILSSSMVFFRDTQYLWGIVSLAWMYATPLFYPETIIPVQFKFIHRFNPMYYMIKFARCILIDGLSPEPALYGWCAICAFVSLGIGLFVFKKTQDKFVLYL